MKTKVYNLKNLDCAGCAAKMEEKINALEGVESASIVFASKKLYITAENPEKLVDEINAACDSVDSGAGIDDENSQEDDDIKKDVKRLIIGAVVFALAEIAEHTLQIGAVSFALYIISYLILGFDVLMSAGKNILKGTVFDENFLMSIATIGAFVIGQFAEGVGVMLFFGIGELAEHIAVKRSRSAVSKVIDMRPETVTLSGGEREIPAELCKVGETIIVRPGDRIPLDGTIVEGESRVDTSSVTGESVPVGVHSGDSVISGCVNMSGTLKIKVDKALDESMVSKILSLVEDAAASKPKIDSFITSFAKVYTPIVVSIAVFVAIVMPFILGGGFEKWIYTALTFLVISCPCALVLSVPLAFFCGIGAGSKNGILLKGGVVLEAAADVKNVVFDKTGTLTTGTFSVNKVRTFSDKSEDDIISLMAACEKYSTHPIAQSIVSYAKEHDIAYGTADNTRELAGLGICGEIDGTEVLLGGERIMEHFGVDTSGIKDKYTVLISYGGELIGGAVISDTIKLDSKSAVDRLHKMGKRVYMLTGDSPDNAKSVASCLSLDGFYAGLLPDGKLEHLRKIRENGSVMFVGDGINDAPVLAAADVGAAMSSGADAAAEAADIVLMKSSAASAADAISLGKKTVAISRQNVVFALLVKVIIMVLGISGVYSNMWLAVAADTGVALICILNSVRIMLSK